MTSDFAAAIRVTEEQLDFGQGDQLLYQNEPFSGICYEVYPNGQLKEERSYEGGLPKGLCREWHDNGRLSREWIAQHGFAPNQSIEWHCDGQLKSVMRRELGVELEYSEWDVSGKRMIHRELQEDSHMYSVLVALRKRHGRAST